jgi:hypothetical protein
MLVEQLPQEIGLQMASFDARFLRSSRPVCRP